MARPLREEREEDMCRGGAPGMGVTDKRCGQHLPTATCLDTSSDNYTLRLNTPHSPRSPGSSYSRYLPSRTTKLWKLAAYAREDIMNSMAAWNLALPGTLSEASHTSNSRTPCWRTSSSAHHHHRAGFEPQIEEFTFRVKPALQQRLRVGVAHLVQLATRPLHFLLGRRLSRARAGRQQKLGLVHDEFFKRASELTVAVAAVEEVDRRCEPGGGGHSVVSVPRSELVRAALALRPLCPPPTTNRHSNSRE